jgi:Tfp pilus assembly protein PilF
MDMVVEVRDVGNVPIRQTATVTLIAESGSVSGEVTTNTGRAQFNGVAPDDYTIRIVAPGFERTEVRVSTFEPGSASHVNVTLKVDSSAATPPAPVGPPILAPKAQHELTRGLQDLRSGKSNEARKHFQNAARLAPNHPDVNYLLGLIEAMSGDVPAAERYLEKAVSAYPKHVLSLTALGEIHLLGGDLAAAKDELETVLTVEPNSWRAHQLLAAVFLKQHSYQDAVLHAERALELGKKEANAARLTLAQALLGRNEREHAAKVLNDFLDQHPSDDQAALARGVLRSLVRNADPTSQAKQSAPSDEEILSSIASARPSMQFPKWTPANIDDAIPPVDAQPACPLNEIIETAGQRVREFIHSVDRFTATETLVHEELNEFGLAQRSEKLNFAYVASITQYNGNSLDVQEFRNGSAALDVFPDGIATLGMVTLVLVFHPEYARDFDFQCEGLTHQRGETAWQVHFREKPDRPGRLRSYRSGNRAYRIGLKGRAWISQSTSQVLRMESDLVNQVSDLQLFAEHQAVEYGPVAFKNKDVTLWLPIFTDLYLDYRGHRIHRRHGFSNYLLFSVEDKQKIADPHQFLASLTPPREE